MKNFKQARFVESSFLFLAISLLVLFSPCAGKAQNNSTVNLAGTVWNKSLQIIEFPSDGTFATIRHSYFFERQGKVKDALSVIKDAGQALTRDYDYRTDEYKLMTRPTNGINTVDIFDGTYEINGSSIYLDFTGYTISATIYSDSMKGELTYKKTNKKEVWIVQRKSNQPNKSTETPPMPGLVKTENGLRPDEGYEWFNPNDPEDLRVVLISEDSAIKHPHRKVGNFHIYLIKVGEGVYRPDIGYRWVNPKDPNSLEVERIP